MTIAVGDSLPDVALTMMDGSTPSLASRKGRALILYFYPKDDTAGCTKEAQAFSERADDFAAIGVDILGVSKDSPAKHAKFSDKYALNIDLATDDGSALEAFGSWIEKSLYGKKYMGIDRSTFLFDADGKLVREWRKVRVPGHVDAVFEAAQALSRD